MCRRVTIQSIEAESFGKSENYLKQKKQWTHTGSGSLSGGARKAQAAAAAGRFLVGAAEHSLSASQWVQQLPVQQQARLNHGLHEARSSKPWHLKQLGSGGFLRWRGWRSTGRAGSMLCLWSENFKLTEDNGHLKPILNHPKFYELGDFSNSIHFSWQRSAERSRVGFFPYFPLFFLVG